MSERLEVCPACYGKVEIFANDGLYSVRCPSCKYTYGIFRKRKTMAIAWNVLAREYPSSIRSMARSMRGSKQGEC